MKSMITPHDAHMLTAKDIHELPKSQPVAEMRTRRRPIVRDLTATIPEDPPPHLEEETGLLYTQPPTADHASSLIRSDRLAELIELTRRGEDQRLAAEADVRRQADRVTSRTPVGYD